MIFIGLPCMRLAAMRTGHDDPGDGVHAPEASNPAERPTEKP